MICSLSRLKSGRFQQDREGDNIVTGCSVNQNEFEGFNRDCCELQFREEETCSDRFARFLDYSLKFLTENTHDTGQFFSSSLCLQENNCRQNTKTNKESKSKQFKATIQWNGLVSPHPKTITSPAHRRARQALIQQIFKNQFQTEGERLKSAEHRFNSSKLNIEEPKNQIKKSSLLQKTLNGLHKSQNNFNFQSIELNNSPAYQSMNPSGQRKSTECGEPVQTPRLWSNFNAIKKEASIRIDTEYQLSTAKTTSNKTSHDNLDYKTAYKVLTQEYIHLFAKYQMLQREFEGLHSQEQPLKCPSDSIAILTPIIEKNTKINGQKVQSPVSMPGKRLTEQNKSNEISNRSKNCTGSSANIQENHQVSIQSFRNCKRNASRTSQSHTFKFLNRKNSKNSRVEIPAKQKSGSTFTLPYTQAIVKGVSSQLERRETYPFPSKDDTHEPITFDNYMNPSFKNGRISFKRQMRAIVSRLPSTHHN